MSEPGLVVWLDPGGRVYHRAGCPKLVVGGHPLEPVVPYDQERDCGRPPCRHCKPEALTPPGVVGRT